MLNKGQTHGLLSFSFSHLLFAKIDDFFFTIFIYDLLMNPLTLDSQACQFCHIENSYNCRHLDFSVTF